MLFNINEKVKVKLTRTGLDILKKQHEELMDKMPPKFREPWTLPEIDKEGRTEFQLWGLMQKFGSYMRMGHDGPFETTIEIPKGE